MKINDILVEAQGATAAFAFGRFNPAHQGHIEVWRAVEQAGTNWFIGTNPSTLGPNDPLTFEQKSAWMEEIYPPIQGHIVPQQSVLTLAAYIFKKLRKNERATVAYITDATDWAWSGKLLNQYNGVEGSHGYYKFAQIIHEPSPRVSSATALRDAARADDRVAFYHASGTDPKAKVAGLTYFDTVKQACEKYPVPVKRGQKTAESVNKFNHNPDDNWSQDFERRMMQGMPAKQKTVAKTWDQMTSQEKLSGVKGRTVWNEKTRKYYTVFDLPAKEVDEASLATMRDYFAGDEDAHDPLKITQQRLWFDKNKDAKPTTKKEFKSHWEYEQWLKQNKLRQISGVREDEQGEVEQQGQLIPFPAGTTKVAVSDVYDWYKLGQVISDLDDADPEQFGQGAPETVIAFGSEEEEHKLLPLLKRLGLKLKDIDQPVGEAYHAGSVYDMLKNINK